MKLEILKIGERGSNGRIWTQEAATDMFIDFKDKQNKNIAILGEFCGDDFYPNLQINYTNATHEVVDMFQENNIMYGIIKPFGQIKSNQYILCPKYYGTINDDFTVNFIELIGLDLLKKEFKFLQSESI